MPALSVNNLRILLAVYSLHVLAHSDSREDTRVLFYSVTRIISVPSFSVC